MLRSLSLGLTSFAQCVCCDMALTHSALGKSALCQCFQIKPGIIFLLSLIELMCVSLLLKPNTMTSRAGALVPDLQRCMDSNRDLAEQLYVLVQTNVEHVSLQDHRQMLKHCRYVLDYLFSAISNAGQNFPQHDIEQFSHMLRRCEIDQALVSERLLQIEKLPAFAAVLSAVPKDQRSWVSIDQQKSYFLSHWLKEAPAVFSSRGEEDTYKPTERGQQLQQTAERADPPPETPKGPEHLDSAGRTAAYGICKPSLSANNGANLAQYVLPHRATPIPQLVFAKSSAGLPQLGNEIEQPNEASGIGPTFDSKNSTGSRSITEKSTPQGEVPQLAVTASPDTIQPTPSPGTKRKRRRAKHGKGISTGISVSRGETLKSAPITLPETTHSTAPQNKKRMRQKSRAARLREELEAIEAMAAVADQDITTTVNERPEFEKTDDGGSSRPVKQRRMEDLHLPESQQEQDQIQESTSEEPALSSPLRRYQGKEHLTEEELASLKAYTLDLLRDLQAEPGQGASANVSAPKTKPTSRRLKAEDFF